jgi:magnesium chelatase subunit D
MGVEQRMEAVKGATMSLLLDAYQRRDRVALIAFRGDRAEVVLRPTSSVEVARARLEQLPTGSRTPLSAGLDAALSIATAGSVTYPPLVVVLSDGRATSTSDGTEPVAAARAARNGFATEAWPASSSTPKPGPPVSDSPVSSPRPWAPAT